ncbi:MAG: marine proteobacterial sortase target protein [Rhodospirillaceae bacterium]|nr:marine proteobacterial sortase target protein [Rhodospirillaceae bacterium]
MPTAPHRPPSDQRFAVLIMNCLAALILVITVAVASTNASANPGPPVRPDEVGEGSLLLRPEGKDGAPGGGLYRAALVQKTEVEIDVSGLVARAVVRQEFANNAETWMEGIYVFPLPHKAAVDSLRLMVGERVIEGRIEERKKAQKQYAQAKRQGKKAALVEAERPNIFTTTIANIAPGEVVKVEIRYQHSVAYQSGEFRLRFPMVVAPRYISGVARIARFGANGWAAAATGGHAASPKTNAQRIAQPVQKPGPNDERDLNPVSLTVRLNAGVPLAEVRSHHHKIALDSHAEDRRTITLANGEVPADRDFELTWRPQPGAAPQAGLFVETDAPVLTAPRIRHALLLLMPPSATDLNGARQARELQFVLDTSGSMGGESIRQAKAALLRALGSLGGRDYFNIVEFNSAHSTLFTAPRPADAAHLGQARAWVANLQAGGGTEMAPALATALQQATLQQRGTPGRLRQVVFMTDGAVGNEAPLFALIAKSLGTARLFMVGIGAAPNSHFMRGAAQAGRGSFVHIGSTAQVGARIDELVKKLSQPALTDIEVRFDGAVAELARDPVPDLYAGEPLLVVAKLTGEAHTVRLSGRWGKHAWRQDMDLQGGQVGKGIGKLWAQRRITALEDNPDRNENPGQLDAQVLALAMDYGLVSRLTALIAVDKVQSRLDEEAFLGNQELAANLPYGWRFEKVFGKSPAPLREASFKTVSPLASNVSQDSAPSVRLPATATPSSLLLLAGLILTLLALTLLLPALFGWRGMEPSS